ncbi:hypothetical protein [Lysobacter gummosus]|uniref:hypothetical protein n=1 Tax=Lysobacter gummosus TaxID=262324 RepID=UPI003633192A
MDRIQFDHRKPGQNSRKAPRRAQAAAVEPSSRIVTAQAARRFPARRAGDAEPDRARESRKPSAAPVALRGLAYRAAVALIERRHSANVLHPANCEPVPQLRGQSSLV